MADEKKTPVEAKESEDTSQEEKKTQSSDAPKNDKSESEQQPVEKSDKKSSDDKQADENGEGAPADEKSEEPKAEEKAPETVEKLSETDQLKAENLTLKTQLEAMKIGFASDNMEDAVTLAEAIVKRDGVDISAALQAVAKKYPDWKSDSKAANDEKSKGGFKVGADNSKENTADNDRLNAAFGIRRKK